MKYGVLLVAAAALAGGVCAQARAPAAGNARSEPQRTAADTRASLDTRHDVVLAVADPLAPPATHAASSLLGYVPPTHYGGAGAHAARTLAELQRRYGWRELRGWPIKALGVYCIVLQPPPGMSRETLLKTLAADGRVRLAQPLHGFSVFSAAAATRRYNDPYVGLERGFIDTDAARAHALSQGKGVDVAVVDTGVDAAHPDLHGQIRGVHDEVDAEPGAPAATGDGHGTEVAGVIAAIGNNRVGIVGMAPEATLSIYKACWYPAGPAAGARCNSFTLAKALAAVLGNPAARIVNMSLGGPSDPLLARLLEKLLGKGRIVIAAMPPDGGLEGFPANVPGVIVVRASTPTTAAPGVLSAPGHDILTTQSDGGYDFVSGSSMAAAHVSGIAALLLALAPELDARTVRALLATTSDVSNGKLQVNAAAAVMALQAEPRSAH